MIKRKGKQKNKQRSTKYYTENKNWATRTPLSHKWCKVGLGIGDIRFNGNESLYVNSLNHFA
jgi:hypothetical protein